MSLLVTQRSIHQPSTTTISPRGPAIPLIPLGAEDIPTQTNPTIVALNIAHWTEELAGLHAQKRRLEEELRHLNDIRMEPIRLHLTQLDIQLTAIIAANGGHT